MSPRSQHDDCITDENQTIVDHVPALKNRSGGQPMLRRQSGTFESQEFIPRLPIPTLEETLTKLPRALEALQTPEEQHETLRLVDEFRLGDGPKLQEMLYEYQKEGFASGRIGSYCEEFWNDVYVAHRESVVLNLNPFFVLEKGPDPKTAKDPMHRAASLCFASLKMASLLKRETLPADSFRGRPLCMDQFKWLFASSRIPEGTGYRDHVHVYPNSSHVVVLVKNQIYYFQALWPEDASVAVDQQDIKEILEAIQKNAESGLQINNGDIHEVLSCEQAVGVLTSLPRAEWSAARQRIMEGDNEHNKEAMRVIESALFVLVLDDHSPKNANDMAANMLHGSHELVLGDDGKLRQVGSCCNRWYDKLQLIICADGTAGVNFEHSVIDGHTALRFASDIYAETVVQFAQSITQLIHGNDWIPDNIEAPLNRVATSVVAMHSQVPAPPNSALDVFPKKLTFQLPDDIIDKIRWAESALADQIVASDTVVLEFHGYGKNKIVKNSLSPDSFVQMSMMLAYYKLYGKFVCTYESVLTKAFYHGRTEAMRGATPQAKELCELWYDRHATKEEKLESLRVATTEHTRLVHECAAGKGIDRHLFALKSIASKNKMPTPELFKSEAWMALNHTVLSTSNCGNPSLRLFGFGPVVPDGFGIGYIIKDHGIQFSVSSKHRQTLRYVNELENTLMEMKRLLSSTSAIVCAAHTGKVAHAAFARRSSLRYLHQKVPLNEPEKVPEQTNDHLRRVPSGLDLEQANARRYSNVVQKKSLRFADIRNLGLTLSFNEEDTETESSCSSEQPKFFEC